MSGVKLLIVGAAAVVFAGCDDPTDLDQCLDNGGIELGGGSCLDMSGAQSLAAADRASIEAQVVATMDRVRGFVTLPAIRIVVDTDPNGVIPGIGVGGFAPNANRITMSFDATRSDLGALIDETFPPIFAHELHHAVRHASAGYGATLVEAAISEGLADHFSVEVFGTAAPPWATALTGEELNRWSEALLGHGAGPYNHPRWFFGSDGTIPHWTGYAVGFDIVGKYLDAHPDARPSRLADEPAGTFIDP